MDEKGFSNDVEYGQTKIFIRSPRTLFALEKVNYRSQKNRIYFYPLFYI